MMINTNILIIEDHEEFRNMLRLFIEREFGSFRIIEAATKENGVEKAVQEKPEIVLIDIRLPTSDGLQAAREIKQHVPDCRIITMSMFKRQGKDSFMIPEVEAFIDKNKLDSELIPLLHKLLIKIYQKKT